MSYPDLPNNIRKYQSEVVAIRGLNLSDNTQDGDLCETRNISCRRYPYFSTRRARSKLTPYANATAITAWEKLVVVQGTNLLYDGAVVGQVAEGAKQFAVVNTKLVIWPDKKYLDIKTLEVKSLTAEAKGTGGTFTGNTFTIDAGALVDIKTNRLSIYNETTTGNGTRIWPKTEANYFSGDTGTTFLVTVNGNTVSATLGGAAFNFAEKFAGYDGCILTFIGSNSAFYWGKISSFSGTSVVLEEGVGTYSGIENECVQIYASYDMSVLSVGDEVELSGFPDAENNKVVTITGIGLPSEGLFYVSPDEGLTVGSYTNEVHIKKYKWDCTDLTTLFKAGDTVEVSGCAEEKNNKSVYIKEVEATKITVTDNAFTEAAETGEVTVARKIPDLDYICESENRLWGCCNADKTIYASALGDPTNFFTYEGISTDSYAVAVGSEGNFTGCAKLSTSVLFWKENVLHKMLGSYPAEYALYTYNVEGLQAGCHKSMQVVNETLFYKGLHGIYAYSGGIPALVSRQFGDHEFTDAVGGTDGVRYFLSVKEGARSRLLAYDIQDGIWLEEDTTAAVDFARIGKDMYFLDSSGSVYLADTGEEDASIEWLMEFVPFYATINYRKRIRKLFLRVTVPAGAWLRVEARFDSGVWCEVGKIAGGPCDDVFTMPVQIARCDKFGLRVSGVGPCCLLGLSREFSLGSDK